MQSFIILSGWKFYLRDNSLLEKEHEISSILGNKTLLLNVLILCYWITNMMKMFFMDIQVH